MKIYERDIMTMVSESIRRILSEAISAEDAYERFYKGKIGENIWNALMDGVQVMTPFHKAVIDVLIKSSIDPKGNENIAMLANRAWSRSVKGQQFLTNIAKEGYGDVFEDSVSLLFFLKSFCKKTLYSEAEYIGNGLVKLYDGEKWMVTCTTSYSASKKYYGDTHWCTASDIFGQYNGFEMFQDYTTSAEDGILVQFVNKEDREKSYQASFTEMQISLICDFNDKQINADDFNEAIHPEKEEIFKAISDNYSDLVEETEKMVDEERDYWEFKLKNFLKKNSGTGVRALFSRDAIDEAVSIINNNSWDYLGEVRDYSSFRIDYIKYHYNAKIFVVKYQPTYNIPADENPFFDKKTCSILDVMCREIGTFNKTRMVLIFKDGEERPEIIGDYESNRPREEFGRFILLGNSGVFKVIDAINLETVLSFPTRCSSNYLRNNGSTDFNCKVLSDNVTYDNDDSYYVYRNGTITHNGKVIYPIK